MDKSFNEINNIHLFYSSFKDYDCLKSRDEFNKWLQVLFCICVLFTNLTGLHALL